MSPWLGFAVGVAFRVGWEMGKKIADVLPGYLERRRNFPRARVVRDEERQD